MTERSSIDRSMTERPLEHGRPLERGRRRGVAGWTDVRGRRLGGWAFILNRVAGLGVLFYLYLHLVVLSQLAIGPSQWNAFVDFFLSPIFLAFDVLLLAGLLLHGLNGIRVALVGFGFVVSRQKALLISFTIIGAIVLLIGSLRFISDLGAK